MDQELVNSIISRYKTWYSDNSKEVERRIKEANKKVDCFLKLFPIESISKLEKDQYVEGKQSKNSFCYWVENELNDSGNIHGATAHKFGLFYSQKKQKYITLSK